MWGVVFGFVLYRIFFIDSGMGFAVGLELAVLGHEAGEGAFEGGFVAAEAGEWV